MIMNGEPPILINVTEPAPVLLRVGNVPPKITVATSSTVVSPPASVLVRQEPVQRLIVTQVPGVGPPGPSGPGAGSDLADHIADPTPHPPYDDQPSLVLLFENKLV